MLLQAVGRFDHASELRAVGRDIDARIGEKAVTAPSCRGRWRFLHGTQIPLSMWDCQLRGQPEGVDACEVGVAGDEEWPFPPTPLPICIGDTSGTTSVPSELRTATIRS